MAFCEAVIYAEQGARDTPTPLAVVIYEPSSNLFDTLKLKRTRPMISVSTSDIEVLEHSFLRSAPRKVISVAID